MGVPNSMAGSDLGGISGRDAKWIVHEHEELVERVRRLERIVNVLAQSLTLQVVDELIRDIRLLEDDIRDGQ